MNETMTFETMVQKTANRPCPICAQNRVTLLHHQQFVVPADYPLDASYDVVHCPRCDFVYADTHAVQSDYDEFYARFSKYEDVKNSTGGGGNTHDAARLKAMATQLADFGLRPEMRVLDIGCATGGLLHELQLLGFEKVCGFDPSPGCVEFARTQFGLQAHVGTIFNHPDAGRFDVVVLSHVLEHVHGLHNAMRSLAALLKEDGILYLEVPDAMRYADFLIAPFQDFNTEHINHFSQHTLNALVQPHGFALRETGNKDLQTASGVPYPALFGFWQKSALPEAQSSSQESPETENTESLQMAIARYIAASRAMLQEFDTHLFKVLGEREVVVWGVGQLTMKLLAETCLGRANIQYFVDTNSINHGKRLQGVETIAPSQLCDVKSPIVIASTIHQNAIFETIRSVLKLDNEVIFLRENRR